MAITKIVQKNLAAFRHQRGLSQEAPAKKAKLSVSYISMLERGQRHPPLHTLEVLAKALGCTALDLLRAA
jgi:transcriptional regulator with XRE-family HTH domain